MSSSPIQIVFYLAFGLYYLFCGVTGLLTRRPRVARHRLPIVLIFILGSTLLKDLIDFRTYQINFVSFGLLLLFLPIFTTAYVLSQTYIVVGITKGQLHDALVSALAALNIRAEPAARDIFLPSLNAHITIKPRRLIGEVEISIDKRNSHTLLNRITEKLNQSFAQAKIGPRLTAYFSDILIAVIIFIAAGILAWW